MVGLHRREGRLRWVPEGVDGQISRPRISDDSQIRIEVNF